jgi:hypothetical protein
MNKRMRELCLKATDHMEGGGDPFDTSFLRDNSIALDEALDMATHFAKAMRLVLGVTAPRKAA